MNNVLSLFDGMSCFQLALQKIGIKPAKYYASEIDKYAMKVTMANFPNTIQLGDVRNLDATQLDKIDIVAGGSPCQSFSFAGKRKGMSTIDNIEITSLDQYLELKNNQFEFEGQSYLFWEYIRILKEVRKKNPNVLFLLENVMMSKKWQKVITQAIGINPIQINSSTLSAQNRNRLYWTNIAAQPTGFFGDLVCTIPGPEDKGILLKDILEKNVSEKYFLSETSIKYLLKDTTKNYSDRLTFLNHRDNKKSTCITANHSKGVPYNMVTVHNTMKRSSKTGKGGTGHLSRNDGKTYCLDTKQSNVIEVKSGTLRTHNHGKGFREIKTGKGAAIPARAREDGSGQNVVLVAGNIRRLTPIECERLQTVPDNYTNHVSDTQRYKMLGNGWTIDVIAYILNFINQ